VVLNRVWTTVSTVAPIFRVKDFVREIASIEAISLTLHGNLNLRIGRGAPG
jgi:hypothetical protein